MKTLQTWFQNQRARQKRAHNNSRHVQSLTKHAPQNVVAPFVPMTEVLIPNSPSLVPLLPPELRPLPTMPYPEKRSRATKQPEPSHYMPTVQLMMGMSGLLYPNAHRPTVIQPLHPAMHQRLFPSIQLNRSLPASPVSSPPPYDEDRRSSTPKSQSCPASPASTSRRMSPLGGVLHQDRVMQPLYVNTALPPYKIPFMKNHMLQSNVPVLLPKLL